MSYSNANYTEKSRYRYDGPGGPSGLSTSGTSGGRSNYGSNYGRQDNQGQRGGYGAHGGYSGRGGRGGGYNNRGGNGGNGGYGGNSGYGGNRDNRGGYNSRGGRGGHNGRGDYGGNSRGGHQGRNDNNDRRDGRDNRYQRRELTPEQKEHRKKYFAELNRELVEWIFENVDVGSYNYKMLKCEADLSHLLSGKHYLSGNYSGSNCLLVFMQHKGRFQSFLIDRKLLQYSLDKVLWDELRVSNVSVMVDQAIYNGTVFDGIYFDRGGVKKYTITDVYKFKGSDYSGVDLSQKLAEARAYFERMGQQVLGSRPNMKMPIDVDVNQLYDMADFDDVINNVLHKHNTMVRGICFFPSKSGMKLLFNYDHKPGILKTGPGALKAANEALRIAQERESSAKDESGSSAGEERADGRVEGKVKRMIPKVAKTSVRDNYNTDSDTGRKLMKRYYTAVTTTDKDGDGSAQEIKATLLMSPTADPDIYNMYCYEKIDQKRVKKQKRDIAYIPGLDKSRWLRELFENDNKPKLMNCVWREEKRKWEPMSVSNAKFPTLASVLDKYFVEVEESDSDSDLE